jgi:hypothetical protein
VKPVSRLNTILQAYGKDAEFILSARKNRLPKKKLEIKETHNSLNRDLLIGNPYLLTTKSGPQSELK